MPIPRQPRGGNGGAEQGVQEFGPEGGRPGSQQRDAPEEAAGFHPAAIGFQSPYK